MKESAQLFWAIFSTTIEVKGVASFANDTLERVVFSAFNFFKTKLWETCNLGLNYLLMFYFI